VARKTRKQNGGGMLYGVCKERLSVGLENLFSPRATGVTAAAGIGVDVFCHG